MALGGTDLNLLLALEALLDEGSVTRAGRRLGLGQPAMSAALAKLRRRFDDQLLVPVGRGHELTPYARLLQPDLRRTVALMRTALRVEDAFEPASDERTFHVAMSDYAAAILLEPLLRVFAAEAPGAHLELAPLDPETWGLRQTLADLDALLAPHDLLLPGRHQPLWVDRLVLIADRANPRLRGGLLSPDALASLPHAAGTLGRGLTPPINQVLRDRGIAARVVLQVTGYAALPHVVRGTHLVAAVPERLATRFVASDPRLTIVPLPGPDVVLTEAYWFSESRLTDQAQGWLHAALERAARTLG